MSNLHELTDEQWETLCSGCGDCCRLFQTNVMCPGYAMKRRCCSDYDNRKSLNSNCTKLTPSNIEFLHEHGVLTDRCNYVRYMKGQELVWDVPPTERRESFDEQPIAFKAYFRATRR